MLDKKIDDLFMNKLHEKLEKKISHPVRSKISNIIWHKTSMSVFYSVEKWFKHMIGGI
jgi:hypothetical protein